MYTTHTMEHVKHFIDCVTFVYIYNSVNSALSWCKQSGYTHDMQLFNTNYICSHRTFNFIIQIKKN